MIYNGLDPNSIDVNGNLPLHYACKQGCRETVMVLIDHMDRSLLTLENEESDTPLSLAELDKERKPGLSKLLQKHTDQSKFS